MHKPLFAAALAVTLATFSVGQNIVQTFAGGGLPRGVQGPTANLGQLANIASDAAGNVYIPVADYNVVLRLDTTGILTVVAGNGTRGYTGDGGSATSAQLAGPLGVAVDGAGNLYIADAGNFVIRKVVSGNIGTIAGSGVQGFAGDNGPALAAQFRSPSGVAVDANGNIYVADALDNRVRKVSTNGTINTFAGTGITDPTIDNVSATAAKLSNPVSVAVDASGANLYIADQNHHRIRRISSGIITTVAGNGTIGSAGDGGPASLAQLDFPSGVALDAGGVIYIADQGSVRVRKVVSNVISTIAGTGIPGFSGDGFQATSAQLGSPTGVAVDNAGEVFVADRGLAVNNSRVRKIANGLISTVAGTGGTGSGGDSGLATNAQLNAPKGIALDNLGNVYIADTNENRIRVVSHSVISTVAGTGIANYTGDSAAATAATFNTPASVAVDSTGIVYIADTANNVVRKIVNGTVTTVAGTGVAGFNGETGAALGIQMDHPSGVAVDATGSLFIADTNNGRIRKLSAGVLLTVAGGGIPGFLGDGGPGAGAFLNAPTAITFDGAGNLYIADSGNHRVRKITGSTITTLAGNGFAGFNGDNIPATTALLNRPSGVAVDVVGNVYIADTNNQRIREVTPNGLITTIAGNGTAAFAGDGGPALSAQFVGPTGIAVDQSGRNIYVADTGDQRIRVIAPPASACAYGLSTTTLQPSSFGGSFPVSIQTTTLCPWTITGLPTWITVAGSLTSGAGPTTLTLVIAANTGASRAAALTIAGVTLSVVQQASNGCTYSINPGAQGFLAVGGTGTITITTDPTCSWTVNGAPSWITITGSGSGTGNGLVAYVVAANTDVARSATLSLPGVTFVVDQAAVSSTGFNVAGSMAHLAIGGGWKTTFWLVNPSVTVAAQMRLSLFDDGGNPLVVSMSFPQSPVGTGVESASSIDRTLAPGALLIVDVISGNTLTTVEGWAQVLSNAPVAGSATFRFTAGTLDNQALVPIENRNAAAYLVPFDNTGGFVAGIALANTAIQAGAVGIIVRDDTGLVLISTTRAVAGFGHTAFVLPTDYPVAAGKRGTVEFDIPFGGQISVLGIQYNNATGGFSTILSQQKQ